jgi:hypothetical protein
VTNIKKTWSQKVLNESSLENTMKTTTKAQHQFSKSSARKKHASELGSRSMESDFFCKQSK